MSETEAMNVEETTDDAEMEASGDSDASSDDSEDEEREETELTKKSEEIQAQIKENPYMYNSHVELIQTLKSLGDLEKLRAARQHMSELFPLSEDLWLEWVRDESKLATDKTSRELVTKLLEKAVQDYLSVPVWLEYVQFAIGGMGEEGIDHVRGVFDRAITACGLHVSKGAMLWEAYREFESAILSGLLPDPGSIPTKDQENKFSEQHDRVSNLFKRQLTVPLMDLKEAWNEYKDWLQEEPDNYCKQAYKKATIKLEKVKPYEENLQSAEAPRLEEYLDYIKYEEKEGDPARIQCLYERAVCENCLNPTLWLQYTKYLDHTLKVPSVTVPVYERSVRNCPWCVQLWQHYILCLERGGQPYEKVKGVFEAAVLSGFSTGQEYLSLWTTFIDYLRRRIKWTEDHTEDLDVFKMTIERAIEQIDEFGAEGDPNGTLRQLWAVMEGKHCKNMEKARELWAEVMAAGRANEAALWMENYRFERAYGDSKHCRRVLQRALNSVTDWPESIVDAYINFEREEGTLEQYDQAVSKCAAQMARITERREKAELENPSQGKKKFDKKQQQHKQHDGKQQQKSGGKQQQFSGKQQQQFGGKQQQQFGGKQQQRGNQRNQHLSEGQRGQGSPEIKPYKRKAEDTKPSDNGFKVPDLPPAKVTKSSPPPGFKGQGASSAPPPGFKGQGSSAPPPGFKGQGQATSAPPPGFQGAGVKSTPPPGFKERDSSPAGAEGEADSKEEQDEPQAKRLKTEEVSHTSSGVDFRTVFISNLSYTVDEDKLKSFFSSCGPIEEVRLVKNFKGKSKGYAYLQFADQFAVVKALTYDRSPIDNRPMYVSKYEDRASSNKKRADFRYATNLEKNKLFIKNLPFTCTKDALKVLFSQHGEVTDVRVVTFKSGQSKGLAYVEFADEQSAAQAIMKTDGLLVGEHEISVALSNPPPRKESWKKEETSFTPSLGGGKKETLTRGVARTQVMLMPRALKQKQPAGKPGAGGAKPGPAGDKVTKPDPAAGGEAMETGSQSSASDNTEASQSADAPAPKKLSNSDFRSMLLKK